MRRSWADADLEAAVRGAESWAGVLRELGLSIAGGNYTLVQNRCRLLGIDASHFVGQRWLAARPDPKRKPLEEIMVEGSTYPTSKLHRRLLREGRREHRCATCGITEWQGQPVPLELDHVNGDRMDHRDENVRLLCCNCHALTPTWRGRNRGRELGSLAETD